MKGTVLLYHVSEEKQKALKEALDALGVSLRSVSEEEVNQRVGYLAGLEGYAKEETEKVHVEDKSVEILVMCEFSQIQFNLLMQLFTHKKIPPVALKAVMTPTNRDWTFARLISDLKLEHFLATQRQKHGKKNSHNS